MSAGRRVTIAGAGLIGRGWAAAFLRAGWEVVLWDGTAAVLPGAAQWVRTTLPEMAAAGLAVTPGGTLRAEADLAAALAGADYVQESLPEDRDIKAALFARLDALAPPAALIGSSTSGIVGSRFLADLAGRARTMVAHPANPPHLLPVVELCPSPWHGPEDTARFVAVLSSIGQVPVVLGREIEGFVMNRLQTAVINEAMALVARGVVAPEGLDAIMKHSLGLRWAFMGPFETMDLNAPDGFADYARRYGRFYQATGKTLAVADDWPAATIARIEAARRQATPRAEVPQRMRWRDRALMRLVALRTAIGGVSQ
ncbi:MAG: 3-hydroxyacyl-CoA dehydrogenase [Rhodobacteraceae bacterium]|nr:3-hydroxyacyl-CoA dehydrogenase [Paracoccaceae bacterium]